MASRFAIAILAIPLLGSELRIGVLSLFRPERISVRSAEVLLVRAGNRELLLPPGSVAGLRAVGAEVDLFADRQLSSSPGVLITGRGGAPASFQLSIEGKIDRKFHGRLEVASVGSRLEPVVKVNLEAAVAAAAAAVDAGWFAARDSLLHWQCVVSQNS